MIIYTQDIIDGFQAALDDLKGRRIDSFLKTIDDYTIEELFDEIERRRMSVDLPPLRPSGND